jgi:hypothetical protein
MMNMIMRTPCNSKTLLQPLAAEESAERAASAAKAAADFVSKNSRAFDEA